MFFKNFTHAPAKLIGFGHPFHGLVQSGQLTLPNASTITYRQPSGSNPTATGEGDTFHVAVPGISPIPRTPAQQSLDTANGWEWWNEAILSGSDRQLYGADGGGRWIYIDGNGYRWGVDFPEGAYSFDSPFNETVSLYRHGVFAAPEQRHDYSVVMNDWGQDTPVLNIGSSDRVGKLFLVSTTQTGDQAIFAIAKDSDVFIRYAPMGFLLLSITGAGGSASINLSVLKTRQETLGTLTQDYSPTPDVKYCAFYHETTNTTQNPPDCGYPVVMESVVEVKNTGWLNTPSHPKVSGPSNFIAAEYYSAGTITVTHSRTDRIIAMWFDGSTPEPVYFDAVDITDISDPLPTITASGNQHTIYNYLGGCDKDVDSFTDTRVMELSRVETRSQTVTFTIRYKGQSSSFIVTSSSREDETKDYRNLISDTNLHIESDQYGHHDAKDLTSSHSIVDPEDLTDWSTGHSGWYPPPVRANDLLSGTSYRTRELPTGAPGKAFHICRPANHLVHINITTLPTLSPANPRDNVAPYADSYSNEQSAFVSPSGFDNSAATLTGPHIYGSWNPVTGQVARGYADPVCWV
ncbi:MAG TPA: hypothetical protein VK971_08630 [Thiohalobacter sp.]|nr:hypothetical protein [Thiohalobacter sp.]